MRGVKNNCIQQSGEDQDFLSQFYNQYSRYVYKLAWENCYRPDDVEDVVQNTWASLCAKGNVLKELSAPRQISYIAVTVKNIILESGRKKKLDTCPIDSVADFVYDETIILDRILDQEIRISNFYKIWPQVDPASREILERKYILEQSDAEIAQSMRISTNSVRTYISRARKTALSVLQNHKNDLL